MQPDYARLHAEACFVGAVPERLAPPMGAAQPRLARASHEGEALETNEEGILLDGLESGDCLRYQVALGSEGVEQAGDDALVSPDWWLWKPEPRPAGLSIRARFDEKRGAKAVVPWPVDPGQRYPHRIPETTFEFKAQAAFGSPERLLLEPPGAKLETFLLGAGFGLRKEAVVDWVRRSAEASAALFGRFPVAQAQLLLVADDRKGSFGYVVRGGGPVVTLLLPKRPDDGGLDWKATHELLHLALPLTPPEGAWLSEGLITYLAALARARAGMISEAHAWWELLDGFARGAKAGTGRTTRQESAQMKETRAYWRVYWAGAAMALMWDVRLHERGTSLPEVLASLLDEGLERGRRVGAEALVKKLDEHCDCDVFSSVTEAHLDETEFPVTADLARALGVSLGGKRERARMRAGAPKAAIRRAIMRTSDG